MELSAHDERPLAIDEKAVRIELDGLSGVVMLIPGRTWRDVVAIKSKNTSRATADSEQKSR